jgi:translation initiation factor 3 subunit M
MPAVAQLEKDGKYALVYRLLQIFLTQRLDSYLEFQAANSALLKSYGISHSTSETVDTVLFHAVTFWLLCS